jgi:hypothetical protein
MSSFRSDMAHQMKKEKAHTIYGELLKQDREVLDRMMGWKDVSKKKKQSKKEEEEPSPWMVLNVEVLNGEEVDDSGEPIEWSGEHKDHTLFRSDLMFRVRASTSCLCYANKVVGGCCHTFWSFRSRCIC